MKKSLSELDMIDNLGDLNQSKEIYNDDFRNNHGKFHE